MNDKPFEKAVNNIDKNILDVYFDKRFKKTQKGKQRLNETNAKVTVRKKRVFLAAAVIAVFALFAAVPLALSKPATKPAPAMPTEPVTPTLTDNALLPSADTTEAPTEPATTAKEQRIVYGKEFKKSAAYFNGLEYGWNREHSKGYFFVYKDIEGGEREVIFSEDNEGALFYSVIDCRWAIAFPIIVERNGTTEYQDEDVELMEKYIEEFGEDAYFKVKEDAMISHFDEIGMDKSRIKERGHGLIVCYITKDEVEKLEKIEPKGIGWTFLRLLPEGYTLEDYYNDFYIHPTAAYFL